MLRDVTFTWRDVVWRGVAWCVDAQKLKALLHCKFRQSPLGPNVLWMAGINNVRQSCPKSGAFRWYFSPGWKEFASRNSWGTLHVHIPSWFVDSTFFYLKKSQLMLISNTCNFLCWTLLYNLRSNYKWEIMWREQIPFWRTGGLCSDTCTTGTQVYKLVIKRKGGKYICILGNKSVF